LITDTGAEAKTPSRTRTARREAVADP
jgi:hypothetical protein